MSLKPQVVFYSGSSVQVSIADTTTLTANTSYKFAITYEEDSVKFYLDGVLDGTADTSCDMPASLTTLKIGRNSGDSQYANMSISNLRAYPSPLTAEQVAAL